MPLTQQATSDDVEFLKTVSNEDILNTRDSNDLSVLHHAVLKDQQDCVEVICERCPELVYHQAKSVFNMTPLMLAAERGHLSMVQTIFEASIKVERDSNGGKKLLRMKDTDARSALWWAVCSNQFEVTKFLLEKDPEFEHGPDVNGNTLLMAAEQYAKSNYPDAGRILELVMEHQKRKEQRGTVLHHEQISIPTNPSPKGDGGVAGKDNRPSETTESDESPRHNTNEKLEVLGREDMSSTPVNVPAPSADVSLWRNKKISAGVLGAATAAWILFELLEYHLLTLVCHALILSLALLFLWSNANIFIKGSAPNIPSVSLPEKQVLEVASALTKEINYALVVLREIASGCDLKMFLSVVAGLWILSIVGGWCNFMTLFYIAFVLLHTVHVLYKKYEDQVDTFAEKATHEIKKQYDVFDAKVLSKIPRGPLKNKKL